MKKRITALCVYALYWLLFFIAARLFFILTQHQEASLYSPGILAATFLNGIKLDISATAYIFIFPLLLVIPGLILNGDWFRHFMKCLNQSPLRIRPGITSSKGKMNIYAVADMSSFIPLRNVAARIPGL